MAIKAAAAIALVLLLAGAPGASGRGAACSAQWRIVAAGADLPTLSSVAPVSHDDVWAVGSFISKSSFLQGAAIAHWDGRKLSVSSFFPKSATREPGELFAVAASSGSDVWAAGDDGARSVVLHWDGKDWREVHARQGTSRFLGIAVRSRSDVWLVGTQWSEHWNGRSWRAVPVAGANLGAVDSLSATDTWAVGSDDLGTGSYNSVDGVVVHWNGRKWRRVRAPTPDDSGLGSEAADDFAAVDAVSRNDAWAAHTASVRSDIQRWDGRRWRIAFRTRGDLSDVVAAPGGQVWAVGGRGDTNLHPLILVRNRSHWAVVPTALNAASGELLSISALGNREIWAAGEHLLAAYSCRA